MRIQASHSSASLIICLTILATGLVEMLWSVRFHLIRFSSFQSLADNSSRKQNDLKLVTNVFVYKILYSELAGSEYTSMPGSHSPVFRCRRKML